MWIFNILNEALGFLANLSTATDGIKSFIKNKKYRDLKILAIILLISIFSLFLYLSSRPKITITQVLLDKYSLTMSIGEQEFINATVLYSNNTEAIRCFGVQAMLQLQI